MTNWGVRSPVLTTGIATSLSTSKMEYFYPSLSLIDLTELVTGITGADLELTEHASRHPKVLKYRYIWMRDQGTS